MKLDRAPGIYRDQRLTGIWRGVLPFLRSYSSWFLLWAFAVTCLAKAVAFSRVTGAPDSATWLSVLVARDALLCFGMATVFQLIERRAGWAVWWTGCLALVTLTASAVSAGYLLVAGELLSWQTLRVGVARFDEVWGIVVESMPAPGWLVLAAVSCLLVALPYACRRLNGEGSPVAGLLVTTLASGVAFLAPPPQHVALSGLADSAALAVTSGYFDGGSSTAQGAGLFGKFPAPVSSDAIASWAQGTQPPNVVVVVLESTRWDVTSLGGGPADTKALAKLAGRGLSFQNVRAVMPHTTKSLWSILCGQYPFMQLDLYETSVSAEGQCLPHILGAAGYRRAFFQSALGSFEDRPRLVANMGFDGFTAWEDIGGEALGFLASDDESLSAPFLHFVDRHSDTPFLAVVLTSATHFPYRMPDEMAARSEELQRPTRTSWDRYARLVEAEDAMLADVMDGLSARGLLDNTIVVALGDHGEGFGEQGVRQHDTNFFEEGLRVPLVIAGPGVALRASTQPANLLDLLPTLLEALGLPYEPSALPGQSFLAKDPAPSPKLFSCWIDSRCRGYVEGTRKVVYVPVRDEAFAFDLLGDPNEKIPLPLSSQDRATLGSINGRIGELRSTMPMVLSELSAFAPWRCARGEPCVHPASPSGGVHGN
ncbi:MAG: sulfatase-like hydrolase/transferase [Acidobacteria bacterium]|nr:sulfatase-like hydrolase/transferase [Acidobacteriota bacterium]